MGKLLEQLKSLPRIAEAGLNKVVVVEDFDTKSVNCQNQIHKSPPDLHGNTHQMKVLLVFGRFNEVTCDGCHTIYRKIKPF